MRTSITMVAAALSLASPAEAAGAVSYTYQTFAVPGATSTTSFSLNDVGDVVGEYTVRGGIPGARHVFLYSHGVFQTVEPAGATDARPVGLANDGTVAGVFMGPTHVYQSYTCRIGTCTIYARTGRNMELQAISKNGLAIGVSDAYDFSSLKNLFFVRHGGEEAHVASPFSGFLNFTSCINNSGTFAGTYGSGHTASYLAYVVESGFARRISIPGGIQINPLSVNNAGVVTGAYVERTTGQFQGFTDLNGVIAEIRDPDGVGTIIYSLNDREDFAGDTIDAQDVRRPFASYDGVFTTLVPNPTADPGDAVSINADGRVLVNYFDRYGTGLYMSYVATPHA